tara:strand:+ start:16114 stop:16908 length:795 start_codon:yes stop_codon:yes gene_type:complete
MKFKETLNTGEYKIFFDMDETLLSSYSCDERFVFYDKQGVSNLVPRELIYDSIQIEDSPAIIQDSTGLDSSIISWKAPYTDVILERARQIVGKDNVFLMTYGSNDYAHACNIELSLGFDVSRVISREDIIKDNFTCTEHTFPLNHLIEHNPTECSGAWESCDSSGTTRFVEGCIANHCVLIDNETSNYNKDKMKLLRTGVNNVEYLQVQEFSIPKSLKRSFKLARKENEQRDLRRIIKDEIEHVSLINSTLINKKLGKYKQLIK